LIALRSSRVVDALETIAGRPVAVSDRVRVDVRVAVARLAHADRPVLPGRVAEVTVAADVAFRACADKNNTGENGPRVNGRTTSRATSVPSRALQTDDGVLPDQDATALVGARAQLAVERGALQRVAVVSLGAPVAVLARGVVLADAPACK